jgi:hypothetical protein
LSRGDKMSPVALPQLALECTNADAEDSRRRALIAARFIGPAASCAKLSYYSGMSVRRSILLALVLYLSADYCDPSMPGVFSFGTESFFVDSVESRSAVRAVLPVRTSPLRAHGIVAPLRVPVPTPVHARADRGPYVPRAQVATSPPAAPGAAEDH